MCQAISLGLHVLLDLIKLTQYDDTKKRAYDSQIVQAKENLKLSHGGLMQRLVSGTNQPIEALHEGRQWVWGLTDYRPII